MDPRGEPGTEVGVGGKGKIKLEEETVKKLKVRKVFQGGPGSGRITSMRFNSGGDLLISAADDEQIVLYDVEKGSELQKLNSKKYGVDLIRFTHAKNTALHSSTKVDDNIRYLSMHDNKYLRFFDGHEDKVTTLCMSPTNDTFLSGSLDKTMRIWDLRSKGCQAQMRLESKPVATFDPDGVIFAVGMNNDMVSLYDVRNFHKGAFVTFRYPEDKENEWTWLKFSPDGKLILVGTDGTVMRLLDGFKGDPLQTFTGYANPDKLRLEADFSAESNFVLGGSADGRVWVWNVRSGEVVGLLNGCHQEAVQCVQFNPKHAMMASACSKMAFWLPRAPEIQD